MARKKRNRTTQRDVFPIATPVLRTTPIIPTRPLVSDRRLYHPDKPFEAPYSVRRKYRRIVEDVRPKLARKSSGNAGVRRSVLRFSVPRKVEMCVRRKRRREVLFALGRTGRGARRRHRRRNYYSSISCK